MGHGASAVDRLASIKIDLAPIDAKLVHTASCWADSLCEKSYYNDNGKKCNQHLQCCVRNDNHHRAPVTPSSKTTPFLEMM